MERFFVDIYGDVGISTICYKVDFHIKTHAIKVRRSLHPSTAISSNAPTAVQILPKLPYTSNKKTEVNLQTPHGPITNLYSSRNIPPSIKGACNTTFLAPNKPQTKTSKTTPMHSNEDTQRLPPPALPRFLPLPSLPSPSPPFPFPNPFPSRTPSPLPNSLPFCPLPPQQRIPPQPPPLLLFMGGGVGVL